MVNKNNLKPNSKRTPDELREICKKGGIASGEKRREKKALKEAMETMFNMPASDKTTKQLQKFFNLAGVELSNRDAMVLAQMYKAIEKEDTQAFNALMDRAYGKPVGTENVVVSGSMDARILAARKRAKKKDESDSQ